MGKFKAINNDKKESEDQLYYVLHNIKTCESVTNKKIEIIAKENGLNTRRLNNHLNTNRILDEKYLVTRQGDHGDFYKINSYLLEGEILNFSKIGGKFYKSFESLICNSKQYKSVHNSYYFLTGEDSSGAFVFFMQKMYEKSISDKPIVCTTKKINVKNLLEKFYNFTIKNLIRYLNAKKRGKFISKNNNTLKINDIKLNDIDEDLINNDVDGISVSGLNDSLGKSHQVLLRELYGEGGSIKSYRKNTGKSIHKALRLNESLKLEALKHLIATVQPSKLIRKFAFAIRNLESIKTRTEGNDKIIHLLREFLIDQNVRIENIVKMRGEIMQVGTPCKRKFEHNI